MTKKNYRKIRLQAEIAKLVAALENSCSKCAQSSEACNEQIKNCLDSKGEKHPAIQAATSLLRTAE